MVRCVKFSLFFSVANPFGASQPFAPAATATQQARPVANPFMASTQGFGQQSNMFSQSAAPPPGAAAQFGGGVSQSSASQFGGGVQQNGAFGAPAQTRLATAGQPQAWPGVQPGYQAAAPVKPAAQPARFATGWGQQAQPAGNPFLVRNGRYTGLSIQTDSKT